MKIPRVKTPKVKICRVGDDIYLLDEGLVGETMATGVYLVLGQRAALVEAGPSSRVAAISPERIAALGVSAGDVSHIFLTHVHLDHSGAIGHLSRQYPNAQIVVHRAGASHVVGPSKLLQATSAVFGRDAEDLYGRVLPVPADRVLSVSGGEVIDLGGRRLHVVDAPGHAGHHLAFYDDRSGGLFAGESLGIHSADLDLLEPAAAPPVFDVFAAVRTARALASCAPSHIYHSHTGMQTWSPDVIERYVAVVLTWAEVVRDAMRHDPSPAYVSAQLHTHAAAERQSAATARRATIDQTLPVSIQLHVLGYMGFFGKAGLGVDLSRWRG